MLIIKIIKIKCSNPSRILNEHASILVYKFRPERTGFNMYAEYTQPQLTFLTLQPWHKQSILMYLGVFTIRLQRKLENSILLRRLNSFNCFILLCVKLKLELLHISLHPTLSKRNIVFLFNFVSGQI